MAFDTITVTNQKPEDVLSLTSLDGGQMSLIVTLAALQIAPWYFQ